MNEKHEINRELIDLRFGVAAIEMLINNEIQLTIMEPGYDGDENSPALPAISITIFGRDRIKRFAKGILEFTEKNDKIVEKE